MWQGLLALKTDAAAVQMYFVSGNDQVAKLSLPKNIDGSTPPLRIFQRMRLEPPQVEGVARKMQVFTIFNILQIQRFNLTSLLELSLGMFNGSGKIKQKMSNNMFY